MHNNNFIGNFKKPIRGHFLLLNSIYYCMILWLFYFHAYVWIVIIKRSVYNTTSSSHTLTILRINMHFGGNYVRQFHLMMWRLLQQSIQ